MSDGQEDKGPITEAKYKDGPCPDRSCTDMLCCIIFVFFCIGMFIIAIFALAKGNPSTLATPYDPNHRGCGVDEGVVDYPYIYFTSPDPDYLWRTVCVKECPTKDDTELKCAVNKYVTDCKGTKFEIKDKKSETPAAKTPATTTSTDSKTTTTTPTSTKTTTTATPTSTDSKTTTTTTPTSTDSKTTTTPASTDSKTTTTTTPTKTSTPPSIKKTIMPKYNRVFNHLVDPNSDAPIYITPEQSHKLGVINFSEKTYIYQTKPCTFQLYCICFQVFGRVCFPVVQQLMSNVQSSVNLGEGENALNDMKKTWPISIASFFIAFVVAFLFLLLMRYCGGCIIWLLIIAINVVMIIAAAIFLLAGFNGTAETDDEKSNLTKQKTIGIIIGVVALIIFILTLCMCKRIRIAIAVLESATLFIKDNVSSLLLPIFTLVAVIAYIVYWVGIALYLYSIGEIVQKDKSLPFASVKHEKSIIYIGYFHFVGLFWILSFILAAADFVLASATSIWYFQSGTGQESYNPMRTSYYRLFRYHLGTIAFGSFILALVWIIQVAFEYIAYQAKKYAGENPFINFMIKCIRCCLACFERFIRFLNKNAYVQTAIKGTGFCSAAKDAFLLMLRNALRFSAVEGIGAFIIFLGRVFICAVTAIIGYIIITKVQYFAGAINSPVYPTVLFGLIGFVIGSVFMSVYGDVADAVLIVFCIDEEIQKVHYKGEALHCPEPLRAFMDTHSNVKQ